MKLKLTLLIACFLSLIGCNKSYDHMFLLQHPEVLQKEANECQTVPDTNAYCEMVKRTVEQYIALVSLQQDEPEVFGQHIQQAQTDLVKQKDLLQQAQQDYEKLRAQQATADQLKSAKEKIVQAQQAYHVQLEKVQTMYAVVASTSSENL